MPLPRLIPCLDVAHGRVVKGVSFVGLRDVGDPVELAQFYSGGGADELVFLDITATPEASATMTSTVERVADVLEIPFTVGGGVRTVDDASRLIESGADRVSLNSAALADPSLITGIANRFGSQAVVVAIDAGEGVVHTHGGRVATQTATVPWAIEVCERGAGEILLTSIRQDGRRSGYDLELTVAVRDAVTIPVIASGGAGSAQHVADALRVADAALVASIVHENPAGLMALRREIEALGIGLRPLKEHYG
jgi:cyclase